MRAQQARAELEDAERDLDEAPERARPSWREAAAGLPWKRIAALAGGVFLVAMNSWTSLKSRYTDAKRT